MGLTIWFLGESASLMLLDASTQLKVQMFI
jgi:hypothetical protein